VREPDSWPTIVWAWLRKGRRRLYALGALAVILAVALLSIFPSGGGVSATRMAELIDSSYGTSGTSCLPSSHGRDTCRLSAEKCRGTIVVAAVGTSTFTIVSAEPPSLDSATCDRGEGLEGEAE
jgi:hypothetical protein